MMLIPLNLMRKKKIKNSSVIKIRTLYFKLVCSTFPPLLFKWNYLSINVLNIPSVFRVI